MRINIKRNTLTDGSYTYDVVLVDNGDSVAFHAETHTAAISLADALATAINEYTVDHVGAIYHDVSVTR